MPYPMHPGFSKQLAGLPDVVDTVYQCLEWAFEVFGAKANQIEPRLYLEQLFERLPKALTKADLLELLPQNFKMSDQNR
ncbi:MAG: transposase domain-containing protein [Gammaproteobacteria bacterium]|nr:transposase domain-containing protein [Gammaproteobacteria bacterium]